MSNPRPILEHLEKILSEPGRGVLGLVDGLLAAALRQEIHLRWQDGCCEVSLADGDLPNRVVVPLRKSVLRAVLARIAALCNGRVPGSVSPFGGQGEVSIDADPPGSIRATFVNTPGAHSLKLAFVRGDVPLGTEAGSRAQSASSPRRFNVTKPALDEDRKVDVPAPAAATINEVTPNPSLTR